MKPSYLLKRKIEISDDEHKAVSLLPNVLNGYCESHTV